MSFSFLYRKIKAGSLLETIIASVIILITYGYFIITFIQINRPDKKNQAIQSYYEQQIICDSLQALHNSDVDIHVDLYEIKYVQNAEGNRFIKASKENTDITFFNYRSFSISNE